MHRALSIFFAAHQFRLFGWTALCIGAVSLVIARLPLPQAVEAVAGDYTRAVGFHLVPVLVVPVVGLVLRGRAADLETLAVRSLVVPRIFLVAAVSVLALAVLLPTALTEPVPAAPRVLAENLALVLGEIFFLGRWIAPQWAWAPITGLAIIGIVSPEQSVWSQLVVFDRTPSTYDLWLAIAIFVAGAGLYAALGPSQRLDTTRVEDADR